MPTGTVHGAFESTWFIQHLPSARCHGYVVEGGKHISIMPQWVMTGVLSSQVAEGVEER